MSRSEMASFSYVSVDVKHPVPYGGFRSSGGKGGGGKSKISKCGEINFLA